jgi:hypothetical protein
MSFTFPALLSSGGIGGAGSVVMLFPFLLVVGVAGTGLWVWMLVDCATKEADTGNNKLAWVLVIALTHVLGAAIYFFVRRPRRIAELGR